MANEKFSQYYFVLEKDANKRVPVYIPFQCLVVECYHWTHNAMH